MKIPITIDYGIHQSQTTFEPTEYYCPHCGEKKVYAESGPGDYYVGPTHVCVACAHGFYLPDEPRDHSNGTRGEMQTIKQLKATLKK